MPSQSLRVVLGRALQRTIIPAIDFKVRLMNWNFRTEHELFMALVGEQFGPHPELKKNEIRSEKMEEARKIRDFLGLCSEDSVLDLGSGVGYTAAAIAPGVKAVHCADISSAFLRACKKETRRFQNVHFHLLRYGSLTGLEDRSITKGYAMSVFIHLNLYDITLYFRELARVLTANGTFLFNLLDSDCLEGHDQLFARMVEVYKRERATLFNLAQWNSPGAVCTLAKSCGFAEATILDRSRGGCTLLLKNN